MMRFNSILFRIISLHALAITATCLAIPVAAFLLLNSTTDQFEHQILREHANTIARYLMVNPNGNWDFNPPDDLRTVYSRGYGGFVFAILDAPGHILFASPDAQSFLDDSAVLPDEARFFEQRQKATVFYGATVPKQIGGRRVWVEIAQDLGNPDVIIDDIVEDFLYRFGWFVIPILFCLLATDIFIVQRAISPIVAASRRARAIQPSSIDVRLPTAGLPAEIRPLVDAVNLALDRLEQGFRLQREFTADAAHELRTPLALLQARIDRHIDPSVAQMLRVDITRMSRIVGQLLEIAELENLTVDPEETTDLLDVCSDIVSSVAPLALAQGKEVALVANDANPVRVHANGGAVAQALLNLVENAIRHTAPGTTVEIVLDPGGTISVLDQGPGIPEGERALVFRRFWRRDRTRAQGAGLGLSIVSRIVEAYAGSVSVENRQGAGAAFMMRFPPAGKM